MPILGDESMKDTTDRLANFCLSVVAEKYIHGSPFPDDVLQCIDKLFIGLKSNYIEKV